MTDIVAASGDTAVGEPLTGGQRAELERDGFLVLLGLLGDTDPDPAWGHDPATVPLHRALRAAGRIEA